MEIKTFVGNFMFRLIPFVVVLLLWTVLIESNYAQTCCSKLEKDLDTIKSSVRKLENSLKANCCNTTSCPNGWKKFNNHCYAFKGEYKSWADADIECKKFDGYLAKIEDSKENQWLLTKAKEHGLVCPWIGLQRYGNKWLWTVDSEEASFVDWNAGEPSGDGVCGELYWGGNWKWNDEPCGRSWSYICEKN